MCNRKQCVILGAGFGLYGYLPAAVNCGYQIFLPKRYQNVFESRKELLGYRDDVFFVENEKDVLGKGDLGIIAKRPEDQYILTRQVLKAFPAQKIVLEKPLAPTPEKAEELCDLLIESREKGFVRYLDKGRKPFCPLSGNLWHIIFNIILTIGKGIWQVEEGR